MTDEDLSYYGNDPGAVKFGNFINYYSFHSTKERINNLNEAMFLDTFPDTIICLDIGCNSGNLTTEFYQYLKQIYPSKTIKFLALDIDSTLINRAEESKISDNITFECLNIMEDKGQQKINEYLKTYDRIEFNITFCFSVTMWIHMNNGDQGLIDFLLYVTNISETIILEAQPWSCYRTANRRLKKQGKEFEKYESLKIRGNVNAEIEKLITANSFRKVCESSDSSWKRKIQGYHKK